ncbi:MAG: acetate--CoA ligase family protein, partial [Dehalococcoidia bacterium]|nr:acetate--CoA ligase family protein [Dehalococcoidia bacterium]
MVKSQNLLTEVESKELLKKAGIPVVEAKLARSKKEAISISNEMGFPVVLKINSSDVVHKSDSGGVKLGLANATQVGKAYTEIISSIKQAYAKAQIEGVSVQPMASPG